MKKKILIYFSILVYLVFLTACMNTVATVSETDCTDGLSATDKGENNLILETPEESDNPEQSSQMKTNFEEQCSVLLNAFNRKMTDAAGWVHRVNDRIYFNNVNGAYDPVQVEEFWYRFDSEGYILEGYNWTGTREEGIQQEGVWLNGWYDGIYVNGGYNLDYDFDPEGEIQGPHAVADAPMDFSAGFCESLAEEESANVTEMDFHGQEAWQFTYEVVHPDETMIRAIYFSRDDGTLLGYTTNLVQPDGSEKLILEVVYRVFEFNADPPEERFAEIWERVPHGDDFVPFEAGMP